VAGGGEALSLLPTTPTLGVRAGLTDRIDVGARLPNLLSAALDAKINLLRGQLDISVNPGLQWYEWTSEDEDSVLGTGTVVYLQAPLLVGYNASTALTLMGTIGPAISFGRERRLTGQLRRDLRRSAVSAPQLRVAVPVAAAQLTHAGRSRPREGRRPSRSQRPASTLVDRLLRLTPPSTGQRGRARSPSK
jgi:hypothetical protein